MAPTVPIEFIGQKESRKFVTTQVMGKSRKFSSKGLSTGFVPDYRHAVETMAESEGFGSSGRIETEMNASDESYSRKRKCINFDTNGSVVPVQVLSLSKLSGKQRKDLKHKLQKELEQVQSLQRKLSSFSSNIVASSPYSDIRSCNGGKKRPQLDSTFATSEVPRNGKKQIVPSRSGVRTKKSNSSRPVSANSAQLASTTNATLMKQCALLLKRLMSHQYGWVFNEPVDVVKLNIPDYFNVIKNPMDLGTVSSKLESGRYASPLDFAADVRLTFSNAMTYNPRGNDVHLMAETLSKNFEVKWKTIEKKVPMVAEVQELPFSTYSYADEVPPSKKAKAMPNVSLDKPGSESCRMTDNEKHKLSVELEALLGELPESIVEFLKEQSSGAEQTSEDEIEIDIEALGDDTLLKLRKLLDDYIMEKQRKQAKSESREMEFHIASGISNSSHPQSKGNEAIDEDVDIVGGNDLPMSRFLPVEIEKDVVHRNTKCSGPSSSSSESSSSSSDSDSGSSSESEYDATKASVPEVVPNAGVLDQKDATRNVDDRNGSASIDKEEHLKPNLEHRENSNDTFGEESAPPERHVSPEKLHRAALLRNRFADTILKAHEKALEKDDKQDPEKLRLQREELERRLKEEKLKLQTEARAVEEALKRAEAKAAADTKKKRDLERELARQALQQMEKTVDMNQNSGFMEDLELLRAAKDESMPSFLEEAAADLSDNGLGSFNFRVNSNPLEQLGLYMKADEEDEEGAEPDFKPQRSAPPDDAEEGEID
ncbi:hypothetical protein SAY86_004654 [Trapa natans]|uniref:Transcription factor GTE10 n=1 Tax=Trapa natans TaxID=22666 RepID=A0AAN7MG20_TRANT|nr:hypothetical protein SAY86_004654 [Trapa natans]